MQLKLYKKYCTELQANNLFRNINNIQHTQHLINFSSNDYLNFANSQQLINVAYQAGKKFGLGSTGSRLLSGNKLIFYELEKKIAKSKKTEAAIIFNSGYQANITVLKALLAPEVLKSVPLVFFDKLNHHSLYNGVKLANAELIRYKHNNYNHLSELLEKYKNISRPKFIVAETLYGMDGDVLDINTLAALADKYQAFLFLDEAHATGILGEDGYGLTPTLNQKSINYVAMGTFSKALGASGAYIACSNDIKDYLINKCGGFIYSTAPSPMIIGAVTAAWDLLACMKSEREKLLNLAYSLRKELNSMKLDTGNSTTHIIPIILRDNNLVIEIANKLRAKNILVSAIRQPTVPTARIRIALSILHSYDCIDKLLNELKTI